MKPLQVHLAAVGPDSEAAWPQYAKRLLASGEAAADGRALLTDDPRRADCVLLCSVAHAGLGMRRLWRHPARKAAPERTFVYSEADHPFAWLPGLYASLPARLHRADWHRAVCYAPHHHAQGLGDLLHPTGSPPRYLFSFVGAAASRPALRSQILRLSSRDALLMDTSRERWLPFRGATGEQRRVHARYAAALRDSAFVLCPAGSGVSSIRIFEAMQCGRVPVIIADDWEPPALCDWSAVSIRVEERAVARIPRIVEAVQGRSDEMGRLARQEWERLFAPSALLGYFVTLLRELLERPRSIREHLCHLAKPTSLGQLVAELSDPIHPPTSTG